MNLVGLVLASGGRGRAGRHFFGGSVFSSCYYSGVGIFVLNISRDCSEGKAEKQGRLPEVQRRSQKKRRGANRIRLTACVCIVYIIWAVCTLPAVCFDELQSSRQTDRQTNIDDLVSEVKIYFGAWNWSSTATLSYSIYYISEIIMVCPSIDCLEETKKFVKG